MEQYHTVILHGGVVSGLPSNDQMHSVLASHACIKAPTHQLQSDAESTLQEENLALPNFMGKLSLVWKVLLTNALP